MGTVRITMADDFSRTPGGRHRAYGTASGEEFRDDHLAPILARGDDVEIVVDGVAGLPPGFLEEAFGGLIRGGHVEASSFRDRVRIVCGDPALERQASLALRFVDEEGIRTSRERDSARPRSP